LLALLLGNLSLASQAATTMHPCSTINKHHNRLVRESQIRLRVGDIASSQFKFSRAMQPLRNYSLVEEVVEVAETTSYVTHPVVHQWAHHSQGKRFVTELS
jgi:hypothetical protein